MTRILITGASGFIGRQILARAIAAGRGEIHAVGRSRPHSGAQGVHWHQADLRSAEAASELVRAVRPTHLIHGAWIATPGVYLHSPENLEWLSASIAMGRAFGEAGGERFVGLGTCAEYGVCDDPVAEDVAPLAPASIYGKCKLSCWWATSALAQQLDFSAAWGRIFLPYGPGDSSQRLVPSLIRAMDSGDVIPTTEGRQARDFIVSTDVADLLFRLLWVADAGAFNIGTGVATPVRTAMKQVADHFDARHLLQFGARPMAHGETMCLVADMTKTRRVLGNFEPVELADGIADAVAEFRSSREH